MADGVQALEEIRAKEALTVKDDPRSENIEDGGWISFLSSSTHESQLGKS